MNSPVLFLIFNRPECVTRVFDQIRIAKPSRLYIAADGPRPDRAGEQNKCEETRGIIARVDWPCEVKTLFQQKNLGPMHAQVTAMDWFFTHEPEGIILEDDCLPDQSFFLFCDELLEHYRDDQRIFMISGNNFQNGIIRGSADYYFSIYTHIWGWATWRRSWQAFDPGVRDWTEFKKVGGLKSLHRRQSTRKYWNDLFENIYTGKYKRGWDYRFLFACWRENGLNVIPQRNLVSNIGFCKAGTNCTDADSPFANIKTASISFPLNHPRVVLRNILADEKTSADMFSHKNLLAQARPYLGRPHILIKKTFQKLTGKLK